LVRIVHHFHLACGLVFGGNFKPWSPFPEIIRTVGHVAFEVDDLDAALQGQEIIFPPGSPSNGVRAAMILHNGAPIELITFDK